MKIRGTDSFTSWLVALACCIINCFTLSAYRLAGLIYVAFLERYDTDRQTASIPIILFVLFRCLAGPVTGFIGQKIGAEEITLIGCVLVSIGFGSCFFAEDITAVAVLLGFIYGVGMAFGSALLPNILRKHFTKHLNSAIGIYSAGSCVGAFIFPPIAVYLLDTYGLSGTYLIVSGILFHGVPIAMLIKIFRSDDAKLSIKSRTSERDKSEKEANKNLPLSSTTGCVVSFSELHSDNENTEDSDKTSENIFFSTHPKSSPSIKFHSVSNEKTEITQKYNLENRQKSAQSDESEYLNSNEDVKQLSVKPHFLTSSDKKREFVSEQKQQISTEDKHPQSRKDYFPLSKFNNETEINTDSSCSAQIENLNENARKKLHVPTSEYSKDENKRTSLSKDISLFSDPTFWAIMLVHGFHAYILTVVWTTLIDYSRDKGIAVELEMYILMFHPLSDMLGRLAFGWIVDKRYLTFTTFAVLWFFLIGLSICGIVLSTNFAVLMAGALTFALETGALLSLLPGICFEFLEKDKHIMAMSCRGLLYVPISFSSSPLIGYFREDLRSYDGLYYLLAVLCVVACLTTAFIPRFSKARKLKIAKSQSPENTIT